MALMTKPFFDPWMAEFQRQLELDTSRGIEDLNLQDARLQQDANLMRPFMERQFAQQAKGAASGVAQRGFAGNRSGPMRGAMTRVGENQAFARGQFEREHTRKRDDIQLLIDRLNQDRILQGAESTRKGAGNAAERRYTGLSF